MAYVACMVPAVAMAFATNTPPKYAPSSFNVYNKMMDEELHAAKQPKNWIDVYNEMVQSGLFEDSAETVVNNDISAYDRAMRGLV